MLEKNFEDLRYYRTKFADLSPELQAAIRTITPEAVAEVLRKNKVKGEYKAMKRETIRKRLMTLVLTSTTTTAETRTAIAAMAKDAVDMAASKSKNIARPGYESQGHYVYYSDEEREARRQENAKADAVRTRLASVLRDSGYFQKVGDRNAEGYLFIRMGDTLLVDIGTFKDNITVEFLSRDFKNRWLKNPEDLVPFLEACVAFKRATANIKFC